VTAIGFVGLGVMGGRIAQRLLAAGHTVVGYNRTPARAQWLVQLGMRLVEAPREAAEASEVVFSMVADSEALRSVVEGSDGILAGLGPGKVYADMSTVSPAVSREIAHRVAATGARMLDAPVSGSVSTLEKGELAIFVGGDEEAFDRVRPLLLQVGPRVTRVGGSGHALLMKIAHNLNLTAQILALSEAVVLAEKAGIPPETAVEVLLDTVIASEMMRYRGPFLLQLPQEAWFNVNMMQKDLLLALDAGRELDVALPTTALANEMLTSARAMGLEKEDFAALFHVLRRMSGLPDLLLNHEPGQRGKVSEEGPAE
jgi:3-hydroxyisobutyrate dehydrogenase-like beta-hydroxyacid dehydrogenase